MIIKFEACHGWGSEPFIAIRKQVPFLKIFKRWEPLRIFDGYYVLHPDSKKDIEALITYIVEATECKKN